MKPLKNQDEFEALLLRSKSKADVSKETEVLLSRNNSKGADVSKETELTKKYDPYVCVQFSASWCGPCKRIDKSALIEKYGTAVSWYICDVDENDYTLGYCGMRKIPSFAFIIDGKFAGRLEGSSSTADVSSWIDQFVGSEK